MAKPDHTVPARPSMPTDDTRTRSRSRSKAKTSPPPSLPPDSIGMAVFALTCLLMESEASQRGLDAQTPPELASWPLSAGYCEGITAAIHHLNLYGRLLGRGPKVTT